MPMPWTYRHASREWRAFLDDVRERSGLASDTGAYAGIEAVFLCFRARLAVPEALRFADILPCVPRAVFVAGWEPAPPRPFADRARLTAEVQRLHKGNGLAAPETIISDTAYALWRAVRHADLARVLATLPPGAGQFWEPPDLPAADLAPRTV